MRTVVAGVFFMALAAGVFVGVSHAQVVAPPLQPGDAAQGRASPLEPLGRELRQIIENELQQRRSRDVSGASAGRRQRVGESAKALARQIRQQTLVRLQALIEKEFGPAPPLQAERVMLEALDSRGQAIELPVNVVARPLRPLNAPSYSARAYAVLKTEDTALALYDVLPEAVSPDDVKGYQRVYTGDAAQALAAEARLLVQLKGGEWREPQGAQAAGNAIAIRGLDLDRGLKPNSNKTYDDTMYLVVNAEGAGTEVYEYRMTTESSNASPGVGRLSSMQVIYVRGLHRGKDPAYRLKGDVADGTRQGFEGTQRIMGANIHSAYAKRVIDSTTPLSPNVSLGCQVVAASKKDFERSMVALLDAKGVIEFPYTIIEGDELAVLERALAGRGKHSLLVEGIPRGAGSTG